MTIPFDYVDPPDPIVAPLCPVNLMRDTALALAASLGATVDQSSSSLSGAVARSMSSALEANAVFLDELADAVRRLAGPVATSVRDNLVDNRARGFGPPTAPTRPTEVPVEGMVLVGQPGLAVSGAFVLENRRLDAVQATVLPTAFVDPAGDEVEVDLRIEPRHAVVPPGGEIVVEVTAVVPFGFLPGDVLHGAVHVPGLTAATVPITIRRLEG